MNWRIRSFLYRLRERVSLAIVYRLPKRIVYLAYFRVLGYATSGKYGTEHPPSVLARDAAKRFGDDFSIR